MALVAINSIIGVGFLRRVFLEGIVLILDAPVVFLFDRTAFGLDGKVCEGPSQVG